VGTAVFACGYDGLSPPYKIFASPADVARLPAPVAEVDGAAVEVAVIGVTGILKAA
jgi:hypothetical protein